MLWKLGTASLRSKAKLKFAGMQEEISVSDSKREKLELELWAVESSRSDAVASAARSTAASEESGAIVLRIQAGLDSANAECLAASAESSRLRADLAKCQASAMNEFNSIQFKNRPKGQCTEHNDNRPQTNRTTKPSIGAATNPDPPMSLATRSSQSTSC